MSFTTILPQPLTAQILVHPGGLWWPLSKNWMRNDYSYKLNTSGLQNHDMSGSPTLNHNNTFWKDSESKGFSAILDWGRGTAAKLEDHQVLLILHTDWMCQSDNYWNAQTTEQSWTADSLLLYLVNRTRTLLDWLH